MVTRSASVSRRVEQARRRWIKHLAAHRASGQTQTAYCRTHGLDLSYFSMWKRRLLERRESQSAPPSRPMQLVPLIVKTARPSCEGCESPITMQVTLRNGVSVSLRMASLGGVPLMLHELAQLSC